MVKQLNDGILLANRYERYGRTACDSKNVVCIFKKYFFDDNGMCKYLISVYKWDNSFIPKGSADEERYAYGYEYLAQVVRKGNSKTISLSFPADWELWEVEDFMETLFAMGELEYYEE